MHIGSFVDLFGEHFGTWGSPKYNLGSNTPDHPAKRFVVRDTLGRTRTRPVIRDTLGHPIRLEGACANVCMGYKV